MTKLDENWKLRPAAHGTIRELAPTLTLTLALTLPYPNPKLGTIRVLVSGAGPTGLRAAVRAPCPVLQLPSTVPHAPCTARRAPCTMPRAPCAAPCTMSHTRLALTRTVTLTLSSSRRRSWACGCTCWRGGPSSRASTS